MHSGAIVFFQFNFYTQSRGKEKDVPGVSYTEDGIKGKYV